MAAFYAVYHGPAGLTSIASRIHNIAVAVASSLKAKGFKIENEHFFDTFVVDVSVKGLTSKEAQQAAIKQGVRFFYFAFYLNVKMQVYM
jgi:glycine dehydrogenase